MLNHKDSGCVIKLSGVKFLCSLVSLCFFVAANGQTDSSKILNQVSVFAQWDSIPRLAVLTSSIPHYRLNELKLRDLAVTDLGGALKFVPGIQLKDYGGIGGIKTVSFRSLGATHAGVTIDGVRIPNVQSGAINLSSFEIFGVDQLSFSTGQFQENTASASSFLAANSISVKSVLTRQPEKINVRIHSSASSIAAFEEGILIQIPLTSALFFGVQGMTRFGEGDYSYRYEPGGIMKPETRQNSAFLSYKLRGVVGLYLPKSQTLLSVNYYNSEQELPGAIILYNPFNDQKLWNEDVRFSVVHSQRISNVVINAHGFYQSAWMRYYDPSFLNLAGYMDDTYLQQNYGGGFVFKTLLRHSALKFFAGTDLLFSELHGSALTLAPTRTESNSVVGLSYQHNQLLLESNLTYQFIVDRINEMDAAIQFSEPSPFVSVAWNPFKKYSLKLRTFYKRAFIMPSFNDLYYNFIGNSNLKPETANMANAGLSLVQGKEKWRLEFSADLFFNRVQNKIIAIPTKDLFNWSMQNIGEIDARGADFSLLVNYKHKKWKLTANFSYTYNRSVDVSDETSSTFGDQIPYTPFHSATSGFCADYAGFRMNLNVLYSGFRYSLNENTYANYLSPFTDISVNLSKEFRIKQKIGCTFLLAAHNILNNNYEVIRSFPMPGRHYQATLNLSIK